MPALLVALLGVAGLVPTIRSAPPPPPEHEPIRYSPGDGMARRLVIILAPQLNERDLALLKGALLPAAPEGGATFAVARPSFMSFEDSSLVLLAGNGASAATPPAPADQPPDTLVRSVTGQGRRAALIGPAEWRALFGLAEPSPSLSTPVPAAKFDALVADTIVALATGDASLVVTLLRDLSGRDLRDPPATLREALAGLGSQLGPRDALLLVGGGALGEPLNLALSGAGVKTARPRSLPLNDIAPTCAVLLGTPFPSEARGRIAWPLLVADERRKAEATAALARQRTWLAIGAVPFGVPYPQALRLLTGQVADTDAEIAIGRYDYGYQLASSNLDQADRQLAALAGATPLPLPRRAAWGLAIPCLAVAALALAGVAIAGAWGTLAASLAGGGAALAIWLGFVIFLQRVIVPNLATVVALTVAHALGGGCVAAWLGRRWGTPRPALAIDLLVLLTALPATACAYRYGLPWRLRLEEATPLFLWRSALLAPLGLLIVGYIALWGLGLRASRRGDGPDAPRVADARAAA